MRTSILITVPATGLVALGWPTAALGQASSTANGLLPTADLEAHFGAKASPVRGSEMPSVSMCSVDLPDQRHGADLSSRVRKPVPPSARAVSQRATREGAKAPRCTKTAPSGERAGIAAAATEM